MSERVKFILQWEQRWNAAEGRRVDVAELCRMFGVSRQTGYVWIRRYQQAGHDLRAMEERSRRPHHNPREVDPQVQDLIVEARKAHPKWGPVPLRRWLVERFPRVAFPSPSCFAMILKRRGLSPPRKRRRVRSSTSVEITPPFPECTKPNHTWCMDFKGWFRLGTREKCYPFTLLDAFSRLLLRCEALLDPSAYRVRSILDSAFREYGLPLAIRSDGGPPFFAPASPLALSSVGIWLLRLGVIVECIAPGKPQQNGRLERFHRTLKHSVDPAVDLFAQQRGFDMFRAEYNYERPHAALGLRTPWSFYQCSKTRYPRPLKRLDSGLPMHDEIVDRRGSISWHKRRLFIGEAFAGERLSLWPIEGSLWDVYFGPLCIGSFDGARLDRGFLPRRRPRHHTMRLSLESEQVSGISLD